MGFYYVGLSILVFTVLMVLIGFMVIHFFGKNLYPFCERLLLKLPFFKQIYPAIKEFAILIFSREKPSFKQVVLVEYPRKGIYSLGFLVNENSPKFNKAVNQELCNVLIPTVPSPFSGFVILVPKNEIIATDISIEQAIKFLVSDGVVNPT